MSLFGKKESYLGIDIGAHGIKLVELRKTKGRAQLWTYGILDKAMDVHIDEIQEKNIEDLLHESDIRYENKKAIERNKAPMTLEELILKDERVNEYAQLLKMLMKEARVESKHATSSLPVSHVFHTILNLSADVEEKDINIIVKSEIAKMISRPIEDMQIVHQKIPNGENKESKYTTYLVTAAPRALVAFYTAIFQRAGLQLEELETEAFALSRSLVGSDKTVSMIVDIGAERTNLSIIDKSVPMTHRTLQIGGNNFDKILSQHMGLDIAHVQQIKKDISQVGAEVPASLFMPILDPIAKEIQYSFDLYLKQSGNEGKRPEKIVLTGGASPFPCITSYLAQEFPLKIFVGDPWARVIHQDRLKPILDDIGPRMSVSIGLALRHF